MSAPQVKSQLEMQEELNKRIVQAEEKKWERDQIHMESQILNTIDLARKKQKILERDQTKMMKYEQTKAKNESTRKKKFDKYNHDREEKLIKVRKDRIRPINREVRKFNQIRNEFVDSLRSQMELFETHHKSENYFDLLVEKDRKDKIEQERKQLEMRYPRRNKSTSPEANKSNVSAGQADSSQAKSDYKWRASTPEYVKQKRKHETYSSMMQERASADEEALRIKISELQEEDERRKELLQRTREERLNRVTEVLSKIDDNRKNALRKYKQQVKEVIHNFVEKQVNCEKHREDKAKKDKQEFEKKNKKFHDALQKAHDEKIRREKARAKKIREEEAATAQKLKAIRKKKMEDLRELNSKAEERSNKIREVLMAHEDIMAEFREDGDNLLREIQERAERIERKKQAELEMVEERKRKLAELEKEKERFKRAFGKFQGNEKAQKRALEKLKAQGLKSQALKEMIEKIEKEEEAKRLAALKKPEDEDQ